MFLQGDNSYNGRWTLEPSYYSNVVLLTFSEGFFRTQSQNALSLEICPSKPVDDRFFYSMDSLYSALFHWLTHTLHFIRVFSWQSRVQLMNFSGQANMTEYTSRNSSAAQAWYCTTVSKISTKILSTKTSAQWKRLFAQFVKILLPCSLVWYNLRKLQSSETSRDVFFEVLEVLKYTTKS